MTNSKKLPPPSRSNDVVLIERVLAIERAGLGPDQSEAEFFEFFSSELVLRGFDIEAARVLEGIIDGENDGGIDAAYLLVDGILLSGVNSVVPPVKGSVLDLVFVQADLGGISETKVLSATKTIEDLLTLDLPVKSLTRYNADLVEFVQLFRQCIDAMEPGHLRINLRYYSASPVDSVHQKVLTLLRELEIKAGKLFSGLSAQAEALTARRLLDLHSTNTSQTFIVPSAQEPLASTFDGKNGYVCLITLAAFLNLIRDPNKNLRRRLLEPNVRDDQGLNSVNRAIAQSLEGGSAEDFWWLNNGVTILSSKVSREPGRLKIDNPQIVNGLQTSVRIFDHFLNTIPDNRRMLLVKVLETTDTDVADRVIRATNSQTAVGPWSLRATDPVQKQIETYFEGIGLYYDRRVNFHRNQGHPLSKIVSIARLGQAVLAVVLGRPNDARARPGSRLPEYEKLFSSAYPLAMFGVAIETVRRVDQFLRAQENCSSARRTDLLYYVSRWIVVMSLASAKPTVKAIAKFDPKQITPAHLKRGYVQCARIYDRLGGTDKVAKGSAFALALEKALTKAVRQTRMARVSRVTS